MLQLATVPHLTEEIPGPTFEEVALCDGGFISEDELDIGRGMNQHARWQRRHRNLYGLVAKPSLTLDEPVE